MNPNYPSPEEHAGSPSPLEQRLKQLQPRPAGFSAETILATARERESATELATRDSRDRQANASSSTHWLTIATACASGAVAGALLTCLVLTQGFGLDTATVPPTRSTELQGDPLAVEGAGPVTDVAEPDADEFPGGRSQWSRSEQMVAAQLVALGASRLTNERPLMAGNYVRLHSDATRTHVDKPLVDKLEEPANSAGSYHRLPEPIRPSRSMDAEQLLQELLGAHPGSRL